MQMDTRRTELTSFPTQRQNTSVDATTKEIPVRKKPSSHSRKECVNEQNNDELVKFMSKLPGYLQPMERGEESSNVLNVGVLDWGRLEKWKHGRAKGAERCRKSSERKVSSALGAAPEGSSCHRCKIDDQVHACSVLGKVKASRGLQHSSHGVTCTLDPESASRDSLNKQETATCSYKSYGRDRERVKNPVKSRRPRSYRRPTSEMGNSGGSLGAKGNLLLRDMETEKRAGEIHAQEARERASECGKQCAEKLDGEEKTVSDSNLLISNIVLLRSRKEFGSTLSGEPQKSLEDDVKVTREVNHTLDFSERNNSSLGLRSQVPSSCPLSFDLERVAEDMMLPLGGTRRHSKTASSIFDQEIRQEKNRHTSPSKRFSFSFGRLSRSFTFKEDSSAGQPLSSSNDTIKSDSMRFDGSACPSQPCNPEKQNLHSGSRVSPLRRLLDPLLKSKVSENVLPSKARSNNMDVPLQDGKKQDTSRTRALFQLTTRNGIPLFQFVVDDNLNNRSILGATMKNSASSFSDDTVQYCTFYSVEEVKKKKRSGSWLIHGHKEKHRGFVYNVIGQMRLCNSMSSNITEKKSESVAVVIRESVLVDESEQVKGRKELAAVVIKKKPAKENLNALDETTVIIPGGVHSFPEKGAPTPLVSRWRSGGLCDCGGWDVGCKLHILSNKTLLHELDQGFKLFTQEESDQDSGPVLAMTELKTGIYRVEFGSFLSHLQAFFVCLTVITCTSEEETVLKTTGKSSSTFAPPLSPVGRV